HLPLLASLDEEHGAGACAGAEAGRAAAAQASQRHSKDAVAALSRATGRQQEKARERDRGC
ncbi:MAG: hypothetical protein VXW43_18985, partial [Pseudomonadota bacterium]|nr:hypothetical protein [Pseudomonadota bacterium]